MCPFEIGNVFCADRTFLPCTNSLKMYKYLRAIVSNIETRDVAIKFCFCKTHASLDSRVIIKPKLPIQMGGHAPGAIFNDPPIFTCKIAKNMFLLLEPLNEELSRK